LIVTPDETNELNRFAQQGRKCETSDSQHAYNGQLITDDSCIRIGRSRYDTTAYTTAHTAVRSTHHELSFKVDSGSDVFFLLFH